MTSHAFPRRTPATAIPCSLARRTHTGREIRPVLVGVADSPSGLAAVEVGMREAEARGTHVRLVRVWRDVGWLFSMTMADIKGLPASQQADRSLVEAAAAYARTIDPGVVVESELLAGDLFTQLREEATHAQLLVLGSGSECPGLVADRFSRGTGCPVLTVDPATDAAVDEPLHAKNAAEAADPSTARTAGQETSNSILNYQPGPKAPNGGVVAGLVQETVPHVARAVQADSQPLAAATDRVRTKVLNAPCG